MMHKKHTADGVITRGYEIYDAWNSKKLSSREIVGVVERAVAAARSKRKKAARIEALALLFALDMRIKERYHNLWRCLFFYFSWRRESRALAHLKGVFRIPNGEDVRDSIEIQLQKIREKLSDAETDDGSDETRGGKRNGKSDAETATPEEKGQETSAEDSPEEIADGEKTEEAAEETGEELAEETPTKEQTKEIGEKEQANEAAEENAETPTEEEKQESKQEEKNELDEETAVTEENAETSKETVERNDVYDNAVDSPLIFEEKSSSEPAEKMSFIDEVIMDNMAMGKGDAAGRPLGENAKQDPVADRPQDAVTSKNEEIKGNGKDAYLYDKMIPTDRGSGREIQNGSTAQQPEKGAETKAEQPKESVSAGNEGKPIEQNSSSMREALQVDINAGSESPVRNENDLQKESNPQKENNVPKEFDFQNESDVLAALHATMSQESIDAYIEMQQDMMREQMEIDCEELESNASVETSKRQEPSVTKSFRSGLNRK